MKIKLSKYHGAGNDFVLIDNRDQQLALTSKQIAQLCHRRFGIGADGLMLLEEATEYDFRMRYFNADGNEASMCGNGGRCIVAFAHHLNIIDTEALFIAIDGEHHALINGEKEGVLDISLEMQDVNSIRINESSYFLDTGSPHHIKFVNNVDTINVFELGKEIRYSKQYAAQGGTNVNFVEEGDNFLKIRTYERGVEDETYACGTGATAVAIAYAHKNNYYNKEILLKAKGGDLRLRFDYAKGIYSNIVLSGPAKKVFEASTEEI